MAFGEFEVHAGDFKVGKRHQFVGDTFYLKGAKFFRERIPVSEIDSLEVADEENVKRLGGTVGWGVVGAVALGPVGLLAGLLAGGRGKDVTFVCLLRDGRRFMATAPAKVYREISASIF